MLKKISFGIITVLIGTVGALILFEGLLRFEIFQPKILRFDGAYEGGMYVADKTLGHRPNRKFPGHDKRGFKNASALDQAEIVVVGDSQTYGPKISMEKTWTSQLALLSGKKVYQMAFGGYGPGHYLQLLDEAYELKPKVIVAALYFGNDILDSYWHIHRVKPPEIQRIVDGGILDKIAVEGLSKSDAMEIADMEERDPEHARHTYLDCQGYREIPDPNLQRVTELKLLPKVHTQKRTSVAAVQAPENLTFNKWLLRYSNLYRLVNLRLNAFSSARASTIEKPIKPYGPPFCLDFNEGNIKTVLSPSFRLLTLTPEDPRVREGERLSIDSFKYMGKVLKEKNISFAVVFIPNKELVFKKNVLNTNVLKSLDTSHLSLVWKYEGEMRERISSSLHAAGIQVIDALPGLVDSLDKGINPYYEDADGHPSEKGNEVIVQALLAGLK